MITAMHLQSHTLAASSTSEMGFLWGRPGQHCRELNPVSCCAGVETSKPSVSLASAEAECPVLQNVPHRTYMGHTADVLDLAWSKSQFLLTASMDKTVRLWHISMEDCLRVFK